MTTLQAALCALTGVLAWSLLEYLLHRFLGHDRRTWPNGFADEHTRHHSVGNYFAPVWKKAIAACVAFMVVGGLASVCLDLARGLLLGASFALAYVAYEVVHRRLHTHRGLGAFGRYLRRHHFHHHFTNPRGNHGVTSPLWDLVFGTWHSPQRVRVPEKLCMSWLRDERTGDVAADFAQHYELVRRPSM